MRHQLVVLVLLGLLEQTLHDRLMPGPIHRQRQVRHDLAASPGPRVALPTIGQCGQVLRRRHRSHKIDEPIVFAGEALIGLVFAAFAFWEISTPKIFANPSFIGSIFVFLLIATYLIIVPLKNAGKADEPAPPSVMM